MCILQIEMIHNFVSLNMMNVTFLAYSLIVCSCMNTTIMKSRYGWTEKTSNNHA